MVMTGQQEHKQKELSVLNPGHLLSEESENNEKRDEDGTGNLSCVLNAGL